MNSECEAPGSDADTNFLFRQVEAVVGVEYYSRLCEVEVSALNAYLYGQKLT